MNMPDPTTSAPSVFLSGKVAIDDGTPLTEGAAVQTICKGQKRTEAYTDRNGNFSFQFQSKPSINSNVSVDDADSTPWMSSMSTRGNQRSLQDCELTAWLPGFRAELVELSRVAGDQQSNIGRIVLHRLNQVDGLTLSATSAAAPEDAKKSYEKGLKERDKAKLDEAQKHFEKAVSLYAKYAVAWFELGRIQLQKNDPAGAQRSFQEAVNADPKYVSPYRMLAQMAAKEKQWLAVVEQTGKLLALNPVNFPDAWFLNAAGYYFQANFEAAEKSARQGLKIDEEHRLPKLDYLLALVLVQKHGYAEAADHVRSFLAHTTNPPDIEDGKKELAEIERLAPGVTTSTVAEKK
jgi:tetratricopeptide (TPR) repeat protein